jgi:hypothetical protein
MSLTHSTTVNPMGTLDATDLFVMLDRTFRRRSRECRGCGFSLPFRMNGTHQGANWSVIPSETCSPKCQAILDEVLQEFQAAYRLAD